MSSKCTGAGKSSVVGALLRLTEIEAGQILIDSMDIRNVRLARLRSAVSVVPQSAFLFEVSLLAGSPPRACCFKLGGVALPGLSGGTTAAGDFCKAGCANRPVFFECFQISFTAFIMTEIGMHLSAMYVDCAAG